MVKQGIPLGYGACCSLLNYIVKLYIVNDI